MEMETSFTRQYINHLAFKHINILTLIYLIIISGAKQDKTQINHRYK
jgi:hypothetical protein